MSLEAITLYELREYDGGDGRSNYHTGFATRNVKVAKEWANSIRGRDFTVTSCIIVSSIDELEDAQEMRDREHALNKLTDREKKLLGLMK